MKNKKRIIGIVVIISTIVLVALFILLKKDIARKNNMEKTAKPVNTVERENAELIIEIRAYEDSISSFEKITVEEAVRKISEKERFVLYTGRITCEDCRRIVPYLSMIAKEKNIKIFYLDSENTKIDSDIKSFREKYEIRSVPSIILFEKDQYKSAKFDYNASNIKYELINALKNIGVS
ncbi:MAG: thioredoxin family protein [Candidatus Fimenecus sp.]